MTGAEGEGEMEFEGMPGVGSNEAKPDGVSTFD